MWDERYATDDYVYGTRPNDFLAEVADRLPPGAVLELGAGEGRNGVWLAGRGHAVTMVDLSAVGLTKAQKLAAERGVTIATEVGDLAAYDIAPGAWPAVVMIFLHLPPALRREVFAKVVAGLTPGGVLVLEMYTPAQVALGTGGPRDPSWCATLDTLRAELPELTFEIGRELERDVQEGNLHFGHSAVVQVVARRPALG